SAQVTSSGAGKLTLTGDINQDSASSSGFVDNTRTPAARISGNLELGTLFSGSGGSATHTITIIGRSVASIAPALIIDATISGGTAASPTSLTKAGGGTLMLAATNTYTGATRIAAGVVDIANNSAFGSVSNLVAIGTAAPGEASPGAAILRAVDSSDAPAARTIANPISLDTNLPVFGSGNLTFTGDATLTGSRNISVFDKDQTTKFTGNFAEAVNSGVTGASLMKLGRGTLELAPGLNKSVHFTGSTTIGTSTADG